MFCLPCRKGLLAAEDYLGALDILQSAKAIVKDELGKLQSLKHVGRKLKEYEGLVSDLLSNRFVTLAVTIPVDTGASAADGGDFSDPSWETGDVPGGGVGNGVGISGGDDGGGAAAALDAEGEGLRRDLELIVQGLLRLGEMEKVLGLVQERVSEDLKLIIRWGGVGMRETDTREGGRQAGRGGHGENIGSLPVSRLFAACRRLVPGLKRTGRRSWCPFCFSRHLTSRAVFVFFPPAPLPMTMRSIASMFSSRSPPN